MADEGVNRLARVLNGRTKEYCNTPPILDFGVIQNNMSLLTNNFPRPIPQSDYMVCRSLTWGGVGSIWGKTQYVGKPNSGRHIHGENGGHFHPEAGWQTHTHEDEEREMEHVHDVLVGNNSRWISPGDRVLVAWVGDDPVVIDIILPATSIQQNINNQRGGTQT